MVLGVTTPTELVLLAAVVAAPAAVVAALAAVVAALAAVVAAAAAVVELAGAVVAGAVVPVESPQAARIRVINNVKTVSSESLDQRRRPNPVSLVIVVPPLWISFNPLNREILIFRRCKTTR